MNKEEFILNIRPANGEPSKEYVMRLNTKLLLENEQLKEKVNQLEEENKQIKERIEYYYEFDEELKKEDLPEELRPYYKNQDCCRYIVELRKENKELQQKLNQLETNRDEAIEYIKHSWRLKFDQVYDTSKDLQGWEVEELLSILERGKE